MDESLIEEFLDEYSILENIEKEPNFFEIAGFPRYENVSSNILAFFLKDKFVMKAFLNCVSLDFDINEDYIEDITREETTQNNNRIDLVIYTNKYVIGIENKINAWLYNPIDEYYNHLSNIASREKKKLIFIVLSKMEVPKDEKYINVLHKDFAIELKKFYPELLNSLGQRYFLLLTEYINNIDNLHGGYNMNEDFLKIAKIDENAEKISQIVVEAEQLRKHFIGLASKIIEDVKDFGISFKNKSVYKDVNDIGYLSAIAVFQDCFFEKNKYNITIDVKVTAKGFEIFIFERDHKVDKFDEKFKNTIIEILPSIKKDYTLKGKRFKYKTTFELDNYDQLISVLREILQCFDNYFNKVDNK